MKKIILGLMLLPSLSFAAPTGSQICMDKDKAVKVAFATHAKQGPPIKIEIHGTEYLLESDFSKRGMIYTNATHGVLCNCEDQDGPVVGSGSLKLDHEDDASYATKGILDIDINLSWTTPPEVYHFQDLELTCEASDFHSGSEND